MASNLMGIYSVAVIAISFKEVADRAFYSEKDSKTPAIFGVVIMVVNVAATLILVPAIGAYAMPVAYGIAAIIGSGGLIYKLNRKIKFIDAPFLFEIVKTIFAAGVMFIAAFYARNVFDGKILNLIFPAICGVAVYLFVSYFIKISVMRTWRKES
jgi:putative peptidoglycan lipid II flippase